jgi:hypothetical protein
MTVLRVTKKASVTMISRRRKSPKKSRVQWAIKGDRVVASEATSAFPLWLAVDAEGGDDRVFAWKTLRGL